MKKQLLILFIVTIFALMFNSCIDTSLHTVTQSVEVIYINGDIDTLKISTTVNINVNPMIILNENGCLFVNNGGSNNFFAACEVGEFHILSKTDKKYNMYEQSEKLKSRR